MYLILTLWLSFGCYYIGRVNALKEAEVDKTYYAIRLQNCTDVVTHNRLSGKIED